MDPAKLSLTILIAVAAACARPGATVTPPQRAAALRLFVSGATTDEIATQLEIRRDDARAVVRDSLVSLVRRYHRER